MRCAAALLLLLLAATAAASPPARAAEPGCKIIWGLAPDEDPPKFDHLTKLESRIQRHTVILHWFLTWQQRPPERATLEAVRGRGSVPFITWEPTGVPLGDIVAGKHDAYIADWARSLAEFNHPVMLAPMHEMDGSSYSWSLGKGNSGSQYVQAWRHIHDVFRAAGANQVIWVFDVEGSHDDNRINAAYPGDAYVDWLGLNPYNWASGDQPWMPLVEIARPTYYVLAGLNSTKPIMFGEWGSVEDKGGDKAGWLREAAQQLPETFPRLKAVVYFNQRDPDDASVNWPLESSRASLDAAKEAFGPGSPYCQGFSDTPAASEPPPASPFEQLYPADYMGAARLAVPVVLLLAVIGTAWWLWRRRRRRTRPPR